MPIIPLPAKVEPLLGTFLLDGQTFILTDEANRWNAGYLKNLLRPPTGFPFQVLEAAVPGGNAIQLHVDAALAALGKEGYRLQVTPTGVMIEAPGAAGVFYGIQTLRQLLPDAIEMPQPVQGVEWSLPCQVITDQPRFGWRGFMLDEGRHFQGLETVLKTLDLLALQKMNVFHWHLTEDQGWRIEIRKYPRLTEVGSQRTGTSRSILGKEHDRTPHGGFYTQAQVRQVVAYAAERNITVVPEIELPGHCTAALAAYPQLSCTGGPFEVATRFGIFRDIYCAGKEAVFAFLQEVLDELLELFPSPYIHIGGDEAPKARWKECPDCQARIRSEGLKDEHALQGYFTNRILTYLHSKGRHGIGWNEILQEGLIDGAAVQFWVRGRPALLEAIRGGKRPIIMSTYLDTYLDHSYSLMPLSRAYRYEPIPAELEEKEAGSILGLEFPLWTEWVPDRARLDYQAYPRLTAAAETGWTPRERKDLTDFQQRLGPFLRRLELLGVRHAPMQEAEPSWWRQKLGMFTIAQPQTKTA